MDGDYELEPARTSGKAIASLILGIASLICTVLTGIPALILGIISLVQIHRSHGRMSGQGLAIGGIITGALGCMLIGPAVLIGLLLPAMQKVREAGNRMQCQNNLKQLALAMHAYSDVNGRLPPAVVHSKDGKPLYSWRVLVLPYLEQNNLYQQFKLDEPWDSPNNQRLLPLMPPVLRDPSAATTDPSTTVYQVFVGPKTAFESPSGQNLHVDFPDGISNTFLIVEAAQAVPWTKPADLPYDPNQPLPKLGGHHTGGFNAIMADGFARFILERTSEATLRGLITRNGGEALGGF